MIKLVVKQNDSNQTLINFLKKSFSHESLAKIYHLFYKKKIKVNNKKITDFKYLVFENDEVLIYDDKLTLINQKEIFNPGIKPKIIYQDEQILIVIKEHGIVVHSPNNKSLDNIIRYYLIQNQKEIFNSHTFIISHQYRLDKLTKGLVIYPKTKIAQQILTKAQANNDIIKKYLAVVQGKLTKELTIKGFIFKNEIDKKMIFSKKEINNGKFCQTIIKPIKIINNFSLIECQLVTGRKHQIRATLAYLNLPIVGDKKYGSQIILENKIMLFAYYLSFKNLIEPLDYLNQKEIKLNNLFEELLKMMKVKFNKN